LNLAPDSVGASKTDRPAFALIAAPAPAPALWNLSLRGARRRLRGAMVKQERDAGS
jgi:hypothetical protein